jgi:hypothetical protein
MLQFTYQRCCCSQQKFGDMHGEMTCQHLGVQVIIKMWYNERGALKRINLSTALQQFKAAFAADCMICIAGCTHQSPTAGTVSLALQSFHVQVQNLRCPEQRSFAGACTSVEDARARCLDTLADYLLLQQKQELQEQQQQQWQVQGALSPDESSHQSGAPEGRGLATVREDEPEQDQAPDQHQKAGFSAMAADVPRLQQLASIKPQRQASDAYEADTGLTMASTGAEVHCSPNGASSSPPAGPRQGSAAGQHSQAVDVALAAVTSRKLPPAYIQLATIILRSSRKLVACRHSLMTDILLTSVLGIALGVAQGRDQDPTRGQLWLLITLLAYGTLTLARSTHSYGRERHIYLQMECHVRGLANTHQGPSGTLSSQCHIAWQCSQDAPPRLTSHGLELYLSSACEIPTQQVALIIALKEMLQDVVQGTWVVYSSSWSLLCSALLVLLANLLVGLTC